MMNRSKFALVLAVTAAAACNAPAEVEHLPVGADVEVIREDGGVVRGTLAKRDERTVELEVGETSRSVPRKQIADARVVDRANPAPLPAKARFHEFTLPGGTELVMSLDSAVNSDTSHVEDVVNGILSDAIVVDGVDVLPAGSIVAGEVAAVQPAGRVQGRASLSLRFTSVTVAGRDERSDITARKDLLASATKGKDAAKIAIPAAGGAIIGGILGGKKGAAIGTAVGGGGGAAVVLSTSGDEIRLARGSTLTVAIDEPIEVRVPITSRDRD